MSKEREGAEKTPADASESNQRLQSISERRSLQRNTFLQRYLMLSRSLSNRGATGTTAPPPRRERDHQYAREGATTMSITINRMNPGNGLSTMEVSGSGHIRITFNDGMMTPAAGSESSTTGSAFSRQQSAQAPQTSSTSQSRPGPASSRASQSSSNDCTQVPRNYDHICKICRTREIRSICLPCAHFCICWACYNRLTRNNCPICHAPIENFTQVFF